MHVVETKRDLRTGMVVQFRTGEKYIAIKSNYFRGDNNEETQGIVTYSNHFMPLDKYGSDFTFSGDEDYDIVAVYGLRDTRDYQYLLQSSLQSQLISMSTTILWQEPMREGE